MLSQFFRKQIRAELKRAYDAGLARGYKLGYMAGRIEASNRGYILASKADSDLDAILKDKGGL